MAEDPIGRPQQRSAESSHPSRSLSLGGLILGIAMMLVAANLRPAFASVGPVLPRIRLELGLSGTAAAILVAIPVLCFGVVSPLAPRVGRRFGHGGAVALALGGLCVGLLIRLAPDTMALFVGTMIAGASVAVANVLLPALVKRHFARQAGLMTGMYTTTLTATAALATGITVPVASAFGGWRPALAAWVVPALIALLAWLPHIRQTRVRADRMPSGADTFLPGGDPLALVRDPLAWQLTVFFGLQSCGYYAVLSWLPAIFQTDGLGPGAAGVVVAAAMVIALPAGVIIPSLAARRRDQRGYVALTCAVIATGYTGLLIAPAQAPLLWAALISLGQAAIFPLALTLIVLRSETITQTAALSALAQGVGYLIAALGPISVGVLHDVTGSWAPGIGLLLVLTLPQLLAGFGAARDRQLAGHRPERAPAARGPGTA